MKRFSILTILCLLVGVAYDFQGGVSYSREALPFEVELLVEPPQADGYVVGEPVRAKIQIKNTAQKTVNIIPPIDGSFDGMRYPDYRVLIKQPVEMPKVPNYPRCGNTNNLHERNFVTLAPQQIYTVPSESVYPLFTPYLAGEYRFSLAVRYDEDKKYFEGFMGEFKWTNTLERLFSKVPKTNVQSATYTIHVASNGKTFDPNFHCLYGMPKEEFKRLYYPYSETIEESNGFSKLPTYEMDALVHFSDEGTIDGIKMTVKRQPHGRTFHLHKDLLLWMRGDNPVIPSKVTGAEEDIHEILVGSFVEVQANGSVQ